MSSFLSRSAVCLTVLTVVPATLGNGPMNPAHAWTSPDTPSLVYSSVPPGYWQPGGAAGRVGSPYYYRASGPFDGYVAGSHAGWHGGGWHAGGYGRGYGGGYDGGWPAPSGGWASGHGYSGGAYVHHFGPGYYRHSERGHYRFPNYSYRRPWYFQGPPTFNRDTNFAW